MDGYSQIDPSCLERSLSHCYRQQAEEVGGPKNRDRKMHHVTKETTGGVFTSLDLVAGASGDLCSTFYWLSKPFRACILEACSVVLEMGFAEGADGLSFEEMGIITFI